MSNLQIMFMIQEVITSEVKPTVQVIPMSLGLHQHTTVIKDLFTEEILQMFRLCGLKLTRGNVFIVDPLYFPILSPDPQHIELIIIDHIELIIIDHIGLLSSAELNPKLNPFLLTPSLLHVEALVQKAEIIGG